MNKNPQNKTPEQMVKAIFALDLEPIKMKLMDPKEGHGWSRTFADHCEMEYKRFLALLAKYPDDVIAPNNSVDKFWHGHILDTMKYAKDCEQVFGYFLHHYPYFGLRGEQDAADLAAAAIRMRKLYAQEFGQAGAAGAPSFCCKAEDRAAMANASFCCKAEDKVGAMADTSVSFCCKAEDKVGAMADTSVSFCCKAEDKIGAMADTSVSFCCKAEDKIGAMADTSMSFCCKAEDKIGAMADTSVSFCCKAEDKVGAMADTSVSFCCKAEDKAARAAVPA